MQELVKILQMLFGKVYPQFGTITIRISIQNGQIETIRLDDITLSQAFKAKDLPQHVA